MATALLAALGAIGSGLGTAAGAVGSAASGAVGAIGSGLGTLGSTLGIGAGTGATGAGTLGATGAGTLGATGLSAVGPAAGTGAGFGGMVGAAGTGGGSVLSGISSIVPGQVGTLFADAGGMSPSMMSAMMGPSGVPELASSPEYGTALMDAGGSAFGSGGPTSSAASLDPMASPFSANMGADINAARPSVPTASDPSAVGSLWNNYLSDPEWLYSQAYNAMGGGGGGESDQSMFSAPPPSPLMPVQGSSVVPWQQTGFNDWGYFG